MACKYPMTSRSYKFCLGCSDIDRCKNVFSSTIPMSVIPSASEANKMTNNAINDCVMQQLAELSKQIKAAILDGKFLISSNGSLKPEARKKLEEIGYKVEIGSQYNESYYTISWK